MAERLQKIISAHGAASRREAESMIKAGRVTVNGVTATLGQSADEASDVIMIDGAPLPEILRKVYIMLNKPRGYVTTMRDEQGRRDVTLLVRDCGARVYPIGRLDLDSEGLLILTNDGDFANTVAHPSNGKRKTYVARVEGDMQGAPEALAQPMEIDGYMTAPAKARLLKRTDTGGVLEITIGEGRNRQIRKLCEKCGLRVLSLKRVSIGGVQLGDLQTGKWRHLTPEEVGALGGIL